MMNKNEPRLIAEDSHRISSRWEHRNTYIHYGIFAHEDGSFSHVRQVERAGSILRRQSWEKRTFSEIVKSIGGIQFIKDHYLFTLDRGSREWRDLWDKFVEETERSAAEKRSKYLADKLLDDDIEIADDTLLKLKLLGETFVDAQFYGATLPPGFYRCSKKLWESYDPDEVLQDFRVVNLRGELVAVHESEAGKEYAVSYDVSDRLD